MASARIFHYKSQAYQGGWLQPTGLGATALVVRHELCALAANGLALKLSLEAGEVSVPTFHGLYLPLLNPLAVTFLRKEDSLRSSSIYRHFLQIVFIVQLRIAVEFICHIADEKSRSQK